MEHDRTEGWRTMITDDEYAEWQYEMYKDEQAEEFADPEDDDDDFYDEWDDDNLPCGCCACCGCSCYDDDIFGEDYVDDED